MIARTRNTPYTDRDEAGEILGRELLEHLGFIDTGQAHAAARTRIRPGKRTPILVLGLCRGGVPVARAVARILKAPLDFCIVQKLSTALNPELAIGALVEVGIEPELTSGLQTRTSELQSRTSALQTRKHEAAIEAGAPQNSGSPEKPGVPSETSHGILEVLNRDILEHVRDADAELEASRLREAAELRRRVELYRRHKHAEPLDGKRVILVDDGAATGTTMRAAIASAKHKGAREIIVALPVAPEEVCAELRAEADAVICPWTPEFFVSVGSYYAHFPQVSDEEVCAASGAMRGTFREEGAMR
jgi:predicted phosphoribosyltransferase